MVRILKTVLQIDVCEALIVLRYWCSKSIWQNSLLNYCNSGVLMKALSIGSWVLAASICYNSSIDSDIRHLRVLDALSICVYSSMDSDIRHFWGFDSQSICVYSSIDSDIRHFWVLDALSICVYSSFTSWPVFTSWHPFTSDYLHQANTPWCFHLLSHYSTGWHGFTS